MGKKRYRVIRIEKGTQSMFLDFLSSLNLENIQVLTSESEKPLVIHYQTKQMTYVKRGNGYAVCDGELFEITEGDLLLLDKGVSHSFLASKGDIHLIHWHWPKENILTDRVILEEYYCEWKKFESLDE